jgi:hypothetical protein
LFIPHPSAHAGGRTRARKGVGTKDNLIRLTPEPFEQQFHFCVLVLITERESVPEEGNTQEIGKFK